MTILQPIFDSYVFGALFAGLTWFAIITIPVSLTGSFLLIKVHNKFFNKNSEEKPKFWLRLVYFVCVLILASLLLGYWYDASGMNINF